MLAKTLAAASSALIAIPTLGVTPSAAAGPSYIVTALAGTDITCGIYFCQPQATPNGVNDSGFTVGYKGFDGAVWDPSGALSDLGPVPAPAELWQLRDVNDALQVTGFVAPPCCVGIQGAFVAWASGAIT